MTRRYCPPMPGGYHDVDSITCSELDAAGYTIDEINRAAKEGRIPERPKKKGQKRP